MPLNFPFWIPLTSGLLMAVAGGYAFLQNRKNAASKYFLGFSLSCGGWAILTAVTFGLGNTSIFLVDLNILSSIFIIPFIFFTLSNFPDGEYPPAGFMKKITIGITVLLFSLLVLFPRSYIIRVVNISGNITSMAGPLYFIFFLILAAYVFVSVFYLYKTYKKSSGRIKAHAMASIISLALATTGALITNTLSPFLNFGGTQTWFGPPFVLIAVISIAYMLSETKKKRMGLWPVIAAAIVLILVGMRQMLIAPSVEILVLSGLVLVDSVFLMSFLVRDYLVENSDRKNLENLLRQVNKANDELKKQDDAKSEFISIASHHLRTPLTSVKWAISSLLDGSYGNVTAEQSKLLKNLNSRNEQYIKFIRGFLDFSKVEAGKIEFNAELFNIVSLLKESIERFSAFAKENKVAIHCDCDPAMITDFYFDKESMQKIFETIIENAIIYKRREGAGNLAISVSRDGSSAIVAFADNGIGIEKEHLDRIGEKFFRSDSVKEYVAEGTGLGVYIAKNLMALQGGDLSIYSEAGKGTTVTLKLPLRLSPPAKEEYLPLSRIS